jgi:hypothetical protein
VDPSRGSEAAWGLPDARPHGARFVSFGSGISRLDGAPQKRSRARAAPADGHYWVNEKDVISIDKAVFEEQGGDGETTQ